ncbi:MAG: helix-turn-helix domain-containing protein [Oscillospiraceae bacterium]|nr:helix-turn-helix domain-containing protein [Oscillospiraceae bacterium]
MVQRVFQEEFTAVKKPDIRQIERLLRSSSLEQCREDFDALLEDMHFAELDSLVLRIYISTDMYLTARSFARELGISDTAFTAQFGHPEDLEQHLVTIDGTAAYLYRIFEQCIRWRIETVRDRRTGVIRNAIRFIDANYMRDDLSLNCIAHEVGLSPSYFSALFKKKTGRCFSDYLNMVRIDRSKQLLCCTTKMVYEIAYEVGFQDYRYFSQIFKKYTGQTPRQYKNMANVV